MSAEINMLRRAQLAVKDMTASWASEEEKDTAAMNAAVHAIVSIAESLDKLARLEEAAMRQSTGPVNADEGGLVQDDG